MPKSTQNGVRFRVDMKCHDAAIRNQAPIGWRTNVRSQLPYHVVTGGNADSADPFELRVAWQ